MAEEAFSGSLHRYFILAFAGSQSGHPSLSELIFAPRPLPSRPLGPMGGGPYFPEHMPVFKYFTEMGASGQYISDVFNAEGVFIARASLGNYDLLKDIWEGNTLGLKAKNGRIYCLKEKPSGYKELVVSRLIWMN
ncbi:MAG: hypothetical protein WAU81_06140 [Candidatus Aminicenantales bacterium]